MEKAPMPRDGNSFGRWFERNDLGVAVPESFILGRTSMVAIGVSGIVAYRNGLAFNVLLISVRDASPDLTPWAAYRLLAEHQDIRAVGESAVFRLELLFANGARASSLESIAEGWLPTSDRPILAMQRGGGGGGWWEVTCLVGPLPPPGPLQFAIEWGEVGVAFQHVIDAAPILMAAEG